MAVYTAIVREVAEYQLTTLADSDASAQRIFSAMAASGDYPYRALVGVRERELVEVRAEASGRVIS